MYRGVDHLIVLTRDPHEMTSEILNFDTDFRNRNIPKDSSDSKYILKFSRDFEDSDETPEIMRFQYSSVLILGFFITVLGFFLQLYTFFIQAT